MGMKSRFAIGLLLAGAVSSYGQQGRSPGGGNTSGRQPSTSTQGRQGTNTGQQGGFGRMGQQQQGLNQPEFQRPIFLSGQVMLADGTPPGEPATIERVCWGHRRPETYTDSKGRFSFQLGDKHSLAFADASTSPASDDAFGGAGFNSGGFDSQANPGAPQVSAFGRVDLSGCELRAVLPGYRSESVQLNQRSIFDKPDIGVIILHRIAKGQGISVSATSLAAPKQARKAYEKALKELRKRDAKSRKPKKAIKELEKAVAEYPEYAAAWSLLGRTRLSINDKEGAREAFDKATKADPKYLSPYIPLLRMELEEQRWAEVNLVSERLLNLNPHMTEVQFYRAVAAFNLGKMDLAEHLVLGIQSGEGSERFPGTHRLLGLIHARQGNFPLAATAYRDFLAAQPLGPVAKDLRRQLTEWEALGVIPQAKTAALTTQENPASPAGEK
jgi:tetratricopeptide (TPR) repeat protein